MNTFIGDPEDCSDARGQRMLDIAAHIHRSGFMLIMVGSGECDVPGCDCEPSDEQWSYSIGLVERGLPEVVITGLASIHALHAANFVYDEFRSGRPIEDGETRWFGQVPLKMVPVSGDWLATDTNRMGHWINHYAVGRDTLHLPPVWQILWGDANGHFPDDPLCDPAIAMFQPVLADDPYSFPTVADQDRWVDDDELRDRIRASRKRNHPSRERRPQS